MVHWYSIDARPVTIDNTTATTTTTGDQVLLQSKSSSSGIYKKTQTYALKKHYKRQMTSSSSAAAAAGKGVASVWTTGSDSVPIIESGKWAHVADRHRVMQVAPEGSSSRKRGSQPPPSTGKENNQPAPTTNFNNASGAGGGRRSVSWIARDFFESGFVQCLDGVQDVLANLETEFKGEEGSGVDD